MNFLTFQKLNAYNQNLECDFSALLAAGETLASATASVTVFSGLDANPSGLLSGSPSVSGHVVNQTLQGGLDGVVYAVVLKAITSLSNHPEQTIRVAVVFDATVASDLIPAMIGGIPVAAFNSVVTVLSVAFTDASTDANGVIGAWAWSFGDGATSIAQNPTHVYTNTGNFTVTLMVIDSYSGKSSTVSHTITISASAAALVSPPGYDTKSYLSERIVSAASVKALLAFTLSPNGAWNIQNQAGAVIGSGNWYYPTTAGIGANYTGEFTPTISSTGTYFTLTNPAASATSLSDGLTLTMLESGVLAANDPDETTGTIQVDIVPTGSGSSSTGTFTFKVHIENVGNT